MKRNDFTHILCAEIIYFSGAKKVKACIWKLIDKMPTTQKEAQNWPESEFKKLNRKFQKLIDQNNWNLKLSDGHVLLPTTMKY